MNLKNAPRAIRSHQPHAIRRAAARVLSIGVFCVIAVVAAAAQADPHASTTQPLEFEVATIRPHPPADNSSTINWRGGLYQARNVTVRQLVEQAFAIPPDQTSGGPPWIEKQPFDVTGKIPDATWQQMQSMSLFEQHKRVNQMLQALLKDRFGLVIEHQPKKLTVWALVQAKGGATLPRHGAPKPPVTPNAPGNGFTMQMNEEDAPLSSLADFLASILGRTVLDQTGLTGNFDIRLRVFQPEGSPADERNAAIFRALEDQLGLRLESRKATVDTIHVDRLQEPSAN